MIKPLPVPNANREAVRYVGTTPEEGLVQLEILKSLGLQPNHAVLEIGCGALIAGYPIAQYVNDGYRGVEPNHWLVDESLLIPEVYDIFSQRSFNSNGNFDSGLGDAFDYILSHSVLSHVSDSQLTAFLIAAVRQAPITIASIRLAEGNRFGSLGSYASGPAFSTWQYPGVSWFRKDDVFARAAKVGLKARIEPRFTELIKAANQHAVHDWIVFEREMP